MGQMELPGGPVVAHGPYFPHPWLSTCNWGGKRVKDNLCVPSLAALEKNATAFCFHIRVLSIVCQAKDAYNKQI